MIQTQVKEHSNKHLTNTFQKCQGPERQGEIEDLSQMEETKKMGQVNETWAPILDTGRKKRH